MSDTPRRYPTRVDWWLGAIAGLYVMVALGIPAWHVGTVLNSNQPWDLTQAVFPLVLLAGMWALAYPCQYEIHNKTLVVRSGLVRVRIPILAINSVKPTKTLVSAPAWSLDRLEISYGRGQRVVVSPKARQAFLDDLVESAPQLVREGTELVLSEDWKSAAGL